VWVLLQDGTWLRRRVSTRLNGLTIEGEVVEDDICREALIKVVLPSSKAGDGASLGAPDLAQRLSLLRLLWFRSLIVSLVSGLSVLGASLLALLRPHIGSIEFDNGNSARMDCGPAVKTTCMFFLAWNIPRLIMKVTGSSLKLKAT